MTLFKHPSNRDVAFEIERRFYVKEKGIWKLRVTWWNVGTCHAPWPMGLSQRIELTDQKLLEFKPFPVNGRVSPPEAVIY
jgi:hypothetical protein